MIKADSNNKHTELIISGDSETILIEFHLIIANLLKSFHTHGLEALVLKEMVDTSDEFQASITNKNFNSKGEDKDD